MDLAVGRVLNSLDELGLAENTVVFFMSDNGGLSTSEGHPTSNLPLRGGKGWVYEGGIREPMIVRAPGITKASSECNQYVSSVDFMPTILELANVQADQQLDGKSFVSLLEGKQLDRGPIYWHYPHYGNQGGSPSAAVRDDNWKLIQFLEDDRYELFDLDNDIGEKTNVISENEDIAMRLKESLAAWQQDVGAKMITPNPNYKPKTQ